MTTILQALNEITQEQAETLLDITSWHRQHGHYRKSKRQRPRRTICPECGMKHKTHRKVV